MRSAYEQNPKLGDPRSIDGQLCESNGSLETLSRAIANHSRWLNEVDKLTNSMAEVVVGPKNSFNGAHHRHPAAYSTGSGSGKSPASSGYEEANASDLYETLPGESGVVGKALSLYGYEANTSGCISLRAQETLSVLEVDQGDGWTRVQRLATNGAYEEGFVPSSYLEIEVFANH